MEHKEQCLHLCREDNMSRLVEGLLADGVGIALEDVKAMRESSHLAVIFTTEHLREVSVHNIVARRKLSFVSPKKSNKYTHKTVEKPFEKQ